MKDFTQETLELLKKSGGLSKAGITTSTGLVFYSLEPQAKLLYPVLTPFRNIIPRVGTPQGSGTAEHWKTITGINSTNIYAGVSEGQRNATTTPTEADQLASYVTLEMEGAVSFQADWAGVGFDDIKALSILNNLQNLMLQEENVILNGNTSMALGTANTPTFATAATGGTVSDGTTNYAFVAGLTAMGFAAAGGQQVPVASTATLVPVVSRTNVDSSTTTYGNGIGHLSAQAGPFTTAGGSVSTVTLSVVPKIGEFGYAWFWGTSSTSANAQLIAVTSEPTVTFTANSTATYPGNSTGLSVDHSTNAVAFDGLITQCLNNSGYYKNLGGSTLTADGFGGVVEIDAAFKYFWDTYRLSPTDIYCDSQTIRDITKHVLAGSSNPGFRYNLSPTVGDAGGMIAGNLVTTYVNKFGINGALGVNLHIHPNMPTGTIYFDMTRLPDGWNHSKVGVPRRIKTRQEYRQIEWPVTTLQYTYGIMVDEILQVYVAFGTGVITGITAG